MINKAIKEDLIRNDIPIDIIPLLFFAMQEIIVNRFAANSNYSFKEITQYLFLILTEGVITEKARNLFKEVK
jgi:hypothetical protein